MNLLQIRTQAREQLDEDTAVFWSDSLLNNAINEAYYYYWQWLIMASSPNALYGPVSLDIVADTATVALPSNCLKIRLIEKLVGEDTWVPLDYYERFEDPTSAISAGWTYNGNQNFSLIGRNLVLDPIPSESATGGLRITYYFRPDRLTSDTASPNDGFDPIFHDLLHLRCVKKAKSKEEAIGGGGADRGPFLDELSELEAQFKQSIEPATQHRSYTQPYTISSEDI